jgi:outer membrane lipoprotein-sorting protein
MKIRSFLVLQLILGMSWLALAQNNKADEIVKRMQSQFERVGDYIVTLTASVDMERLRVPKMEAKMYFKQPNKVHFESKGFAMLPREGVAFNPSQLSGKYTAVLEGEEQVENTNTYRLVFTAKQPKTRPQGLILWVDQTNSVAKKLETVPYEGRSVVALFEHSMVQDNYLMPSKITVKFAVPEMPSPETGSQPGAAETQRRGPQRTGTVTVTYTDYHVNVGLSDSLFTEPESRPK